MAATSTLQDNFNENTILSKWNTFQSATPSEVAVQNQRLEITHSATSEYNALESNSSYDMTGSFFFCQILNAGNQSLASHEVIMYLRIDGNNKLWFTINGGQIKAFKNVAAGGNTQVGSSITYDSTIHKWFRFRESGGTTFWDTSTDGIYWINQWSLANPFAVTSLLLAMQSGCFATEASGSFGYFDNFNIQIGINDMLIMFR